jgi:hypothetical protein
MDTKKMSPHDNWIRNIVVGKLQIENPLFVWVRLTRSSGETHIFDFILDWWAQLGTYRARLIEFDSARGTYIVAENTTLSDHAIVSVTHILRELYGIEHVHMRAEPGSEERVYALIGAPTIIPRSE